MHTKPLPPQRILDNVLPLYFDLDSISTELAAKIIDVLSQLSLRTTGHSLEIVATRPELPPAPH